MVYIVSSRTGKTLSLKPPKKERGRKREGKMEEERESKKGREEWGREREKGEEGKAKI